MQPSKIHYETINPFTNKEKTKQLWTSLQERCEHSYFLSWGWMDVWLDHIPDDYPLTLVIGKQDGLAVVGFFLGYRQGVERKVIYANRAFINKSGHSVYDSVTLEYNAILIDKNQTTDDAEWLLSQYFMQVDEFRLEEAIHPLTEKNIDRKLFSVENYESTPSYFIDLDKIRANDNNYLGLISKNKRAQIKRSIKEYNKEGALQVTVAQSLTEALSMFEALMAWHQKGWVARGEKGSFSNPFMVNFHTELIQRRFEKGEIQICHVHNDTATVGFLYYFSYQGQLLFYQCGFNYRSGNHYRPGIVSHYLSVMHFLETDAKIYNFLASESSYKRSLATDSDTLISSRFRRKKLRFFVEDKLSTLYQIVKKYKPEK